MEHYHEVPVFVQETNEVITVTLSAEQLEAVKAASASNKLLREVGQMYVPIQSSTGEVQSRTEHVESKTEQVHLDQENRTEKETVDHNSERTDTPIKGKKKDNAIDILGEIQKSYNDFRVYLEKKNRKEMKKD
nr:unnamed protein product [Callosobruchus analis]